MFPIFKTLVIKTSTYKLYITYAKVACTPSKTCTFRDSIVSANNKETHALPVKSFGIGTGPLLVTKERKKDSVKSFKQNDK